MDSVDWDKIMEQWEGKARVTNVNPIKAIFGNIKSMTNCIVNITLSSMNDLDQAVLLHDLVLHDCYLDLACEASPQIDNSLFI